MKKLLLSLAFATALSAPAFAQECCSVNSSIIFQQGVNNGALSIQNAAGDDLKIEDDAFEHIGSVLDLGDLTIQNVANIEGGGIVQNINDKVEENANVVAGEQHISTAIEETNTLVDMTEITLVSVKDNVGATSLGSEGDAVADHNLGVSDITVDLSGLI
jgi:hypothetical protein